MPARKPRPADEKPQRDRFIEAAREVGASEDLKDFEQVFRRVVKNPKDKAKEAPKSSEPDQ